MKLMSPWAMGVRRLLPLALTTFFIYFLYSVRQNNAGQLPLFPSSFSGECPLDVEYLKTERYGLSNDIIFHRQCIRAVTKDETERSNVADIQESIFGRVQDINLSKSCRAYKQMPCDPIELEVATSFPERQYTELMFGVATSFERLVDSVPQLSHWLGNSGATLVATVADASEHEQDLDRLLAFYNDYGVDLIITRPMNQDIHVNQQHFTVIRDLLKHAKPETKWIGIIDDDTFFPSLYPISEVLSDQEDGAPAYLGSLSEDTYAIQVHGLMAYGGAGVFMSMPLIRELEPHIETCLQDSNSGEGDALLKNCIYGHTSARLTLVAGLNQLDFRGDPSGFYESGRFPLSLHHWKTWHDAPVDQMAKAAKFCSGCFLQRWRFGDNTVLSNGYSVTVYYDGISQDDLTKTEGTMWNPHQYDWSYGPMRPKTEDGRKKSYYLVESERVGGSLKQVYIHHTGPESKDEVLELWWDQ